MRATDYLRQAHEEVKRLFGQLQRTPVTDAKERQGLLDMIADDLEVHTKIEEEIFYPALRAVSALVKEAEAEHDEVARLIGDVDARDPAGNDFQRMSRELQAKVEHHVAEEEGSMFRDAQRLGDAELERLGRRLEERQRELKSSTLQRGLRAAKLAAKKAI